jgi:DNA-binding response OmpR family regulator
VKLNNHKVLLVEDDEIVSEIISLVFSELGLKVVPVHSLKAALEVAEKETSFGVIIVDYTLPDGFSTEILPLLKEKLPQARVIGISSFEVSSKFFASGADMFIKKPFEIVPLARKVKEMLIQG